MKKIIILFAMLVPLVQLQSQILNVSEITQEEDQWCWAGVSACILDYYCTPTSQCSIAEYTRVVETFPDISFGDTDCCISPSTCNNWNYNWGGAGSIQDILVHFAGISNSGVGSSLSQDIVTSNIQENKVFVIRWGWSSGGGHFIVGHGLVEDNMYYMDPWFGEGLKIADYSWVCSGDNHTWTHTNKITCPVYTDTPSDAGIISGPVEVCQGQSSVTYTVEPIANASKYAWTLPSGVSDTTLANSIDVDFDINATSGDITVKGINHCSEGVSSTLAITMKEVPSTPTITLNGLTLQSDASAGNQWYDQNGSIENATNQQYTVSSNGDYYVIVTMLGCSSEPSNTITVTVSGNEEIEIQEGIRAYPNPVSNELVLELMNNELARYYEILNSNGQIIHKGEVLEKTIIRTEKFAPGIYIIKLDNGKTFEFKKILKK